MELSTTITTLYNSRKFESEKDYDLYDQAIEMLYENPEFIITNIDELFKCLDDSTEDIEYMQNLLQLLESVNIEDYVVALKKALIEIYTQTPDILATMFSRVLNTKGDFIEIKNSFKNAEIEEKKVLSTVLTNIKEDDETELQKINENFHLEKIYNSDGIKHRISKINELLSIL